MKAAVFRKYGPPENLCFEEVPTPSYRENEVLIRVKFTAVNDYDWSMVRGKPYLYRLMFGISKPKNIIPGMELSGVVEAVGSMVTQFKPGDEVYGDTSEYGFGTFAEYIAIKADAVFHKPANMSFADATALPHAALLAYQGLITLGKLQKGEKVLINGAGGGVGTLGLQIALQYGCEVTGVDTGPKLKMMQEIGFNHVIDYKSEDFTKKGSTYDLILDCKTTRGPVRLGKALSKQGRYITVGGQIIRLLQIAFLKAFSSKKFAILALKTNQDLDKISEMYEQGQLKPVHDHPFSLKDASKALSHFGSGKHQGKVLIKIE